jgi:transglutaminase-like putative cysteine protease
MSWLKIWHETTYRYAKPVRFGPHRLLLRPREGHDVRVEEMRLAIEPFAELVWSRDLFGNSVATAHFEKPAEQLRIRSDVLLEQTLPFPVRSTRPIIRVPFPVTFSEAESVVAAAYLEPTYPEDIVLVRKWVEENVALAAMPCAEDALATVTRTIRQLIKYRRREEKGVQTPGETLAQKCGSCRDMATLMLEVLRSLGLPARFASGYLDCVASEAGRASTHAWAEAYLPECGWIGYDPTLGEPTAAKHVVTGVSNHPRGVMPISGSFFDEAKSYLGMDVIVQTQRIDRPGHHGQILGQSPKVLSAP